MIKKYSLKLLQKAINLALSLDEKTAEKLHALQGKVIEVIVEPLDIRFFIHFVEQTMALEDNYEGTVNTIIHSSPLGLIRLSFLPASKARSLFNDKIRLSGDVELGHQVKKLFDELDIDWEGHLAQFTGDVVAHQLGSIFRQGKEWKERLGSSLRHQFTEYIHEEQRLFPSNEEIQDFFQDIDELTMAVERLQARIQLLMTTHETN